jgi:hypothetical protein
MVEVWMMFSHGGDETAFEAVLKKFISRHRAANGVHQLQKFGVILDLDAVFCQFGCPFFVEGQWAGEPSSNAGCNCLARGANLLLRVCGFGKEKQDDPSRQVPKHEKRCC